MHFIWTGMRRMSDLIVPGWIVAVNSLVLMLCLTTKVEDVVQRFEPVNTRMNRIKMAT